MVEVPKTGPSESFSLVHLKGSDHEGQTAYDEEEDSDFA